MSAHENQTIMIKKDKGLLIMQLGGPARCFCLYNIFFIRINDLIVLGLLCTIQSLTLAIDNVNIERVAEFKSR